MLGTAARAGEGFSQAEIRDAARCGRAGTASGASRRRRAQLPGPKAPLGSPAAWPHMLG